MVFIQTIHALNQYPFLLSDAARRSKRRGREFAKWNYGANCETSRGHAVHAKLCNWLCTLLTIKFYGIEVLQVHRASSQHFEVGRRADSRLVGSPETRRT